MGDGAKIKIIICIFQILIVIGGILIICGPAEQFFEFGGIYPK